MRFRLTTKLCVIFACVMGFSMALNVFLNVCNFYSTFSDLAQSRLRVVGEDLQAAIEYGLTINLSLKEMDNIQTIIHEIKQSDSEILSISIVDGQGIAVHDTDEARVGKTLPQSWLKVKPDAEAFDCSIDDVAAWGIDIPVYNSFGVQAGYCLIRCAKTKMQRFLQNMTISFIKFCLIMLAVLLPLGSLLFYTASWPLFKPFEQMERKLKALIAGTACIPEKADEGEHEMESYFSDFQKESLRAIAALKKCRKGIDS